MLDYELLQSTGILHLHPETPLLARDFAQLNEAVNRRLSIGEPLKGIIISADDAMGWEDFSDLVSHVVFDSDQHQRIKKIATLVDSTQKPTLQKIEEHFNSAEIRLFSNQSKDLALEWLSQK